MCLLAILDERKLTRREFDAAWDNNPHGAGFAWAGTQGRTAYRKGLMTRAAAWKAYGWVEGPHVAHFRLASSGGVTPGLTHPFEAAPRQGRDLAGETRAPLLFHNGVYPDWERLLPELRRYGVWAKPPLSDTAVLALWMGLHAERDFERVLNHGGKYAICLPGGRVRTFGQFTELDGARFSNTYSLVPRDYGLVARRRYEKLFSI